MWEIYNRNCKKSEFHIRLLCLGKYIYDKYEIDNESLYNINNLL